ncbi:PAS domain S-box protein [Arenimonas sp. MALMAid1274]|uniref:PAS domain S-box protein n=1 Tax=Arenimonas sp. MALMAid1274 TaxID=3411630 RepID=UPI003BA06A24
MKRMRQRGRQLACGATRGWLPLAALLLVGLCAVLAARWRFPEVDWLTLVEVVLAGTFVAVSVRLFSLARQRATEAGEAGRRLQAASEENERTRLALAAAERELSDIFESISDAFYTLDREWRFVLLNPRAEQLMQRARGELRGQVVWDAFPEVRGSEIERHFRTAVAENRTVQFEVHFPPLATWFNVRAFPHPNGLAVYFQDVGDRKRVELQLQAAQATSERAQRLARLGAWEYDFGTGELRWSDDVLRIFGMDRSQLARGLPALLERVHPEDRDKLMQAQRSLRAGGEDSQLDYRVVLADGETRHVREIGTRVTDGNGTVVAVAGAIQDITESQRAEAALRQITSRLEAALALNRLVMDNSLDIICAMDMNGRFSQVSAACQPIWGYAPQFLIGRAYLDFLHPDDRGESLRAAAEIRAGHPTLDFRNRFITASGQVRTMQWSSVWSPRDRLMFAVARDVTDSQQQSRALVEAKESLMRAQAVSRLGAWELDVASGRLHWSERVHEIFRVGPEEFSGRLDAFTDRVHPEDLEALLASQARTLAGEGDLDLEHRILLPDGGIGYVHERARLLRDELGRPWLLSGTVQDVTERRQQEVLLRESEQRLRTIVDSALDGIVSMSGDGRIVEFNPAAERIFGCRRDAVVGQLLADVIVPERLREAHAAGLRRYLATGRAQVMQRRLQMPALRADGTELLVELAITRLGEAEPVVFTGFVRDITESRRAEALEAGQRAILAGIAARRPLAESLSDITLLYEQAYPDALCSILLLDEAGQRLLLGAAPSLPAEFSAAIHGAEIGHGVGSCGTAAWRGERVVVSDIAGDPLWRDYAALAAQHDLRACWSVPVKRGDGRVLATFATYYRGVREPTVSELLAMDTLGSITAMAIEQAHAYQALADARDAAENSSRQLRRLSQAAIAVNRNLGDAGLYQQLVDQLRETLGSHLAVVSLNVDGSHAQQIHAVSLSEKYAAWKDYTTPSDGSGIYALVCETNQAMRLDQAELEAHPRWRGYGPHAAGHPPLRGWLAVPLIASDGRNLGLLQLSDKDSGDFTEDDEQVAVQFAQMASIAIERAALMQRLAVRDRFFDMSLEVFVIFDPVRMRWVQVNAALENITGYSAQELCSRDFLEFVHPDDRAANAERARRLREGLPVAPSNLNRYLRRGGGIRWLEWVSVRSPDGLVYGVARDVTDRRQAELALRQSLAELDSRNRELQDFAFIASHDLQEPLRKIRAFSDRLQQRYAAQLPPEARDYLDRSGKAASRMQTLIDDLLAYSRVARGNAFVPVDLNALLATVLEDLEARLESSGGRVQAGDLPTLDGDASQLRQLFQNLLSNALKFRSRERPPLVTLDALPVSVDGIPAWEIRIADNGIGFDPRHADRIFGPFQRLHGRQDYEGTGIGLAIVRRIAERHGGSVTAEGRPGEGAVFRLVLPQHPPAEAESVSAAPPGPVSGRGLE